MPLADVINAVRTLQNAHERLESLRAEKQSLQDRIQSINTQISEAQAALVAAKQDAKAKANAEL